MSVENVINLDSAYSVTIGVVFLFIGMSLTRRLKLLQNLTIPEPVTGGLMAAIIIAIIYYASGQTVSFDLSLRDTLLLYFFTTIGLNAKLDDIRQGGSRLVILLVITIVYLIIQDIVGITTATLLGRQAPSGLLTGSAALMGGHGTVIAWAPIFESHGVKNAMEIGIASATFGLILASLIGGPIAKFLIKRNNLQPKSSSTATDIGVPTGKKNDTKISYASFLSAFLAINICILIGQGLFQILNNLGIMLPLFVCCLLVAIILTNVIPLFLRKAHSRKYIFEWPSQTAALSLLAELSLGMFLVMSLMSMQLWTLVSLAGPMFIILFVQLIVAVIYILFIVYRAMGKDYDAAVISAGFGGIALGATATAIINMTAVTRRHGASHVAFIVLPLVSAFFLDIANSIAIKVSLLLVS